MNREKERERGREGVSDGKREEWGRILYGGVKRTVLGEKTY